MNTYSSSSPNPYAKRYLTKGRRSLDNNNAYLNVWPNNKKLKRDPQTALRVDHQQQECAHNRDISQKSETYNFLTEDNYIQSDFHELYDNSIEFDRIQEASSAENCIYLNENDHEHVVDENSVFIDGATEEYSIDFIDETDSAIIDTFNYGLYQEQPLYNPCFLESQYASQQPIKSKRKQGIVGRPTLSSPQRLLVPDNVYSRGNPCFADAADSNYFTDNNYRNRGSTVIAVSSKTGPHYPLKKPAASRNEPLDHDDVLQRNAARSRPRILSKPILPDYRQLGQNSHIYFNATEQDAFEIAQRTVANREFARNLVKRAERQGTVIDKNKIPLSVFEQQPVEVLMKSALDEHLSGIAEIKESEQVVAQPFTTTISVSDSRKSLSSSSSSSVIATAPVVVKKELLMPPKPPQMTASDILKQKWKAASRQQS